MVEVDAQRKLIDLVKRGGGYASKWAIKGGLQGVPDLIMVKSGQTYFLEVKFVKNTAKKKTDAVRWSKKKVGVTPGQRMEIERLRVAGAMAGMLLLQHTGCDGAEFGASYYIKSALESDIQVPKFPGVLVGYGKSMHAPSEVSRLVNHIKFIERNVA